MVPRYVSVFALLAVANAGNLIQPAIYSSHAIATPLSYAHSSVGSTQENVVRSFAGTVSQYSKAVDTPFSSVRKTDTRVNNNVYSAAPALTYAAPVTNTLIHPAPLSYSAPVSKTLIQPASFTYAAPVTKTLIHGTPLTYTAPVAKTFVQPAHLTYAAPVTKTVAYAEPFAKYSSPISYSAAPTLLQAPVAKTFIHQTPLSYAHPATIAHPVTKITTPVESTGYTTKTISYSPAAQVAHVNFDGFGAHYEW